MPGPFARSLDQALLASRDTSVRLAAARRLVPCDVPLGGWAALAWMGVTVVDGRTGPGGSTLLPVPVCTGPAGRLRPRPGLAIDRSTLTACDVVEHDGALATTAERSCLDVMRFFGAEEGLVAADAAVRAGLTTRQHLVEALNRMVGLKGVPQARIAVPLVNPVVVDRDGRFVARTDLLDPEAATVGEYDGGHHRDLPQHTADNVREEALGGLNLEVTRSTALDLWPNRPLLVARLTAARRRGLGRDRSKDAWGFRPTCLEVGQYGAK